MSLMMSIAQLFFRKSSTWYFGFLFCLYYEVVLLWQMPLAWVTFWKSTWGTRMTPSDVKEKEKRQHRKGGAAAEAKTETAAPAEKQVQDAKTPRHAGRGIKCPKEKHAVNKRGKHANV